MKTKDHTGKVVFLSLFTFLLLAVSPAFGDGLTFSEALERLQQTNESLKAARSEVDRRSYERNAARGLYLPKIETGGRYTRIDEPINIDLNDIRTVILKLNPYVPAQMIPPFELKIQNASFWKANVSGVWPIFTGGQILAANRAADAFVTEAKEKKRGVEFMLMSELARRYFGVQLGRAFSAMREEELTGLDSHLFQVRKMEEAGMVAHVETLHAEVARSEADTEFKAARKDEELARTALDNIIEGSGDAALDTPLFIVRDIESVDRFRSLALDRNPALKQVASEKQAAHQAYKKEVGAMSPQVFLFGEKELHTQDLTILEPKWAYGIGVALSLFEGGTQINRVKTAQAVEEQVGHMEKQARRDVETLVDKRYQELMKDIEQFDSLGTAVSSAEEYLRVRTRSFQEGYATSLDVVDARLAVTRAKMGRLAAAYKTDCALAELLEASGVSELFEDYRGRADLEVKF